MLKTKPNNSYIYYFKQQQTVTVPEKLCIFCIVYLSNEALNKLEMLSIISFHLYNKYEVS